MAQTHAAQGHEQIETSNLLMIVLILVDGRHRRHRRDRAAVLPALDDAAGAGPQALHRTATRRARHLQREGCFNCHSQMIRRLRAETLRYGPYSLAGESSTTIRSCGAASARAPTCAASAASTATSGTAST